MTTTGHQIGLFHCAILAARNAGSTFMYQSIIHQRAGLTLPTHCWWTVPAYGL